MIVGAGVVSPAGSGLLPFWRGLTKGISFAELLEWPEVGVQAVGCRVNDEEVGPHLSTAERRRLDRIAHLAIVASDEAVAALASGFEPVPDHRRGLVAGVGFGGISTLTSQHVILRDRGPRRLSPFSVPAVMPSSVASVLAIRHGIRGPVATVSSACASGTHAIGDAARLVWHGRADVVLAGGAEAPLDPLPIGAFGRMDALTQRLHDPLAASRPFDQGRDGFVIGEGSAWFVLAGDDVAVDLGAPVLGEVLGFGLTTDATHLTAPDDGGSGAARAIRLALDDAGLAMADLSHVNAHGTSTKRNDETEAAALMACARGGEMPPAFAPKGAVGHLMGAAGAVELVASLVALRERMLPPTANYSVPDPTCPLDLSAEPRPLDSGGPALSCSFGFGGQNAVVVVGAA